MLVAAILFGCTTPPPHGTNEYTKAHPIKVIEKTFQIELDLAPNSSRGWATLNDFVTEFHRRGKSHLFLFSTPHITQVERAALLGDLRVRLASLGVKPHQIISDTVGTNFDQNPNVVIISFSGAVAKVPECPDWSGENGFNPTNAPNRNFGCSFQRNIGLMVSDPANLLQAESSRETITSETIQRVMNQYETGVKTISEPPPYFLYDRENE